MTHRSPQAKVWLIAITLAVLLLPLATLTLRFGVAGAHWLIADERTRVAALALNSLALASFAIAIATPAGLLLGTLLGRGRIAGRRIGVFAVTVALFVPLPVWAVAWQIVLGNVLPAMALTPGAIAWRPWAQGLAPAAFVHAIAAVPWVALVTAVSLRSGDAGIEEAALVHGGVRDVLRFAWRPRFVIAVSAAALWITVQTWTEISVTDAMMVRTFAEEVYTQIVGVPEGVASAIALTLPVVATASIIVIMLFRKFTTRRIIITEESSQFGMLKLANPMICSLITHVIIIAVCGLPLAALAWKSGGGGARDGGSLPFALGQLQRVVTLNGSVIAVSIVTALAAGAITATAATLVTWQLRHSTRSRMVLLVISVLLALTPGPLIGLSIKELILTLVRLEASFFSALNLTIAMPPLRLLLYDQPSPVPYIFACIVRYFPVAVLLIATAVARLPAGLIEQSMLDGLSVWRMVGRPCVLPATVLATVVVAGLSLGEVSAGKLVLTPGCRLFVLDLFDQMHYGAESTVCAMALVQIALAMPVALLAAHTFARQRQVRY
jgi:iron(III) transport system permease protein